MNNKFKASKSVYRKQQFKTYTFRLIYFPINILFVLGIGILFIGIGLKFLFFTPIKLKMNKSNDKLSNQSSIYKVEKKKRKLDKKSGYNIKDKEEQNVNEVNENQSKENSVKKTN